MNTQGQVDVGQQILREKMELLAKQSERKLYELRSIWPFDFFVDRLTISDKKITIRKGLDFWTEDVRPLLISDILSVDVTTSFWFATMVIELRAFQQSPDPIRFLWRTEAAYARRLITGLIVCQQEKINCEEMPIDELIPYLEKIGSS
jgi:hypothetical protein